MTGAEATVPAGRDVHGGVVVAEKAVLVASVDVAADRRYVSGG
jgi:hypothetical protein